MSTHGWNSGFMNARGFGRDNSRPYGSSPTVLACRICDKIYLSAQSLIEHYESHQDEFAQQMQTHQGTNILPYQRERFNHRLSPSSSVFQQRPHPYLLNGYRNGVANGNSSFLASTQNQQLHQTRTHPVGNNSTLPVSLFSPISMTGRSSDAGTSQSAVNQQVHVPNLQLGPSMNNKYATQPPLVSNQKSTPAFRIEYQKGYDESGDKRTKWYLGQLEQPIPDIIDLESHEESHEFFKLNLRR